MNIQLRSLITASLQDYRQYFQKFKKDVYPRPEEVIEAEKDWHNPINEVFLEIKLKESEEGEIVFSEDLFDTVMPLLLRIVDQCIEETREFPRPNRNKEVSG
jgi:hypothetical protein